MYRSTWKSGEKRRKIARDRTIHSDLTTQSISQSANEPKCEYTVRRDSPNGPIVTFANVGDQVLRELFSSPRIYKLQMTFVPGLSRVAVRERSQHGHVGEEVHCRLCKCADYSDRRARVSDSQRKIDFLPN